MKLSFPATIWLDNLQLALKCLGHVVFFIQSICFIPMWLRCYFGRNRTVLSTRCSNSAVWWCNDVTLGHERFSEHGLLPPVVPCVCWCHTVNLPRHGVQTKVVVTAVISQTLFSSHVHSDIIKKKFGVESIISHYYLVSRTHTSPLEVIKWLLCVVYIMPTLLCCSAAPPTITLLLFLWHV